MSKIKSIVVRMDNLTDEEQLQLWDTLLFFAANKLPNDKILDIYTIKDKGKEQKQDELGKCDICGMPLDNGWLYYEKNGFKICKFCYDDLELKGDDAE